jgi:hypothetical protein
MNEQSEDNNSAVFVWTKMQTESGMALPEILAIKEIERLAGNGIFWWGVGNSLGARVWQQAERSGGTLPALFSIMLSRPKKQDAQPSALLLWTEYEDVLGHCRDLPEHVLEFSRDHGRKRHFALICHSHVPLAVTSHGAFNPDRYKTIANDKRPGSSQTTVLLRGDPYQDHPDGKYHFGFRATLVKPWAVTLRSPVPYPSTGSKLFNHWKEDWKSFIRRIRSH